MTGDCAVTVGDASGGAPRLCLREWGETDRVSFVNLVLRLVVTRKNSLDFSGPGGIDEEGESAGETVSEGSPSELFPPSLELGLLLGWPVYCSDQYSNQHRGVQIFHTLRRAWALFVHRIAVSRDRDVEGPQWKRGGGLERVSRVEAQLIGKAKCDMSP